MRTASQCSDGSHVEVFLASDCYLSVSKFIIAVAMNTVPLPMYVGDREVVYSKVYTRKG